MGRNSDNKTTSRDLLRSKKSLREILQVATHFELTARDFYQNLIPKVSKQIRYLVEDLAKEEQQHYDLFSGLMENSQIEQQLTELITIPVSDSKFSDAVHAEDLGEKPDDQAILQYALYREQAAMEQYSSLAEEVDAGPVKDLFTYLAHEETQHKKELEKIYYQIVHSGGV